MKQVLQHQQHLCQGQWVHVTQFAAEESVYPFYTYEINKVYLLNYLHKHPGTNSKSKHTCCLFWLQQ